MNCAKCSAPANNTATFCEACGAALNQTERVDPLIGRTFLNQYIIRKKLGEGGFGCVYEAEQPSMGRKVAIKTLHKHLSANNQIVARFHREAMAASRLEHPFSLKMYNSGEAEDGTLWIAMEFLQGQTLDARIKKGGAFTLQDLLPILEPVCEVLEEAHQKGIVHRDLKPENIFLLQSPSGKIVPKLLDFGISALVDDEGLATKTGVVSGTPAYMSPEQWQGLKNTDARSDIYSLGMIVYQCLSARLPFQADSTPQWMQKHCLEAATPLMQTAKLPISQPLNDAVMKAIQKDPAKRYQSVLEMYRSIAGALVVHQIEPSNTTPPLQVQNAPEVMPPPKQRPPVAIFIGVALAVALLVIVVWASGEKTTTPIKAPPVSTETKTLPASTPTQKLPVTAAVKRERSLFLQTNSGVGPEFLLDISGAPYQGRGDAKLTVVVFGSFADKSTPLVHDALEKARKEYGDELKLVWMDLPLSFQVNGVAAALAARGARAQGEDKFWAMYELLSTSAMLQLSVSKLNFEDYAKKIPGLDVERWSSDIADPTHEENLRNEVENLAQRGITGTPTIFINGELLRGEASVPHLADVLQRQYARAEAQLAIGIDRKDLYADLTQDGYTSFSDLRARIPGPDDTTLDERLPRAPSVKPNNVSFYQVVINHGEGSPDKIEKYEAERRAKQITELARTKNIDFQRLIDFYSDVPSTPKVEAAFPGVLVKPVEDVAFAMSSGQVSDPIDTEFGYIVIYRFESTSIYDSLTPKKP